MSIVLYIFAIVVGINCCYFLLFSKFSFAKISEVKNTTLPSISVIVCAKNEADNLAKNIPLLLSQRYPNFELVLINDSSIDATLEIMEKFAEMDQRIKIVDVENNEAFWANKKYALTLGIKKASYQHLLFTDADCAPASEYWIQAMASKFSEEKQLILGYGAYQKEKGPLNMLIRYETLLTATQYFGYAKAGLPYMGVGRNLAYTSGLYYDNNGYMSHVKILSGDDDLFVNEVATAANTAISSTAESFTYSTPKRSFAAWVRQKKRHVSTAAYYKPLHKMLLGCYYLSNLLFWVLTSIIFIISDWEVPAILIGIRVIMQYITVGMSAKRLGELDLIPFLPIFDAFLVLFQLSIFISNRYSKQTTWN